MLNGFLEHKYIKHSTNDSTNFTRDQVYDVCIYSEIVQPLFFNLFIYQSIYEVL